LKRSLSHEGSDEPHDEPNPVPEGHVEETIQQGAPEESVLAVLREGIPDYLGKLKIHQQVYV